MFYHFVGGPLHGEIKELEEEQYHYLTVEENPNLFELTPYINEHIYRPVGDLMIYVENISL
jgi:hypothetical protein